MSERSKGRINEDWSHQNITITLNDITRTIILTSSFSRQINSTRLGWPGLCKCFEGMMLELVFEFYWE
jgi:hypothetical protein